MLNSPRSLFVLPFLALAAIAAPACAPAPEEEVGQSEGEFNTGFRVHRYNVIRDAASANGIDNTAYLLAGIAYTETGLAHCWSEAMWACQGPPSPDCGGGPVIAGAWDGPCYTQQGGLGMFQFDAGNFGDTLGMYSGNVLTVEGQVAHAINYVVNMVRSSVYTANADTPERARDWVRNFDVYNPVLRDQWIKTVVQYYNGCQPGWSCWGPRYGSYNDGLQRVLEESGGTGFWTPRGTTCPGGNGRVIGEIEKKYLSLGGCGSFLGAPVSYEGRTPDGIGRYSVFENGSIYWTEKTGAHEVNGAIRSHWAATGWERGPLGYPLHDERAGQGGGRVSVFQNGAIFYKPEIGTHEVYGSIYAMFAGLGSEGSPLGYPTSGEYGVPEGRRNDFEGGSITWHRASNQTTVTMAE
ncbi:MAG TPA: hypothetical protein VM925_01465 [Labilithrix sp.]|nr:hypothetical protein [Labilithrix sp.]